MQQASDNKANNAAEAFLIQTNKGELGQLTFRQDSLQISYKKNKEVVAYRDLIGYKCTHITENRYKVQVNSFPKLKKIFAKEQRYLSHTHFFIQTNQQKLQQLKTLLLRHATNRNISNSKHSLRFLIYFNPNAGSNSKAHLAKVTSFLAHTNFQFDVIETTHRNHCKQHLNQINPSAYESVIIISGDGLMHEFVNSQAVEKIAVTHVPAGSGNAFAKTQTSMAGQDCTDETAIYLAVKGRRTSMNLIKMQLQKQPSPIYSFLSLEWAFLAEIDMNSEFLRMFGGLRFQMYSAYRCMALRRYTGKLTYSQTSNTLPTLNEPIVNPSFVSLQTNFLNAIFCSIPYISDKYHFAPLLKVEDRAIDMQYTTEQQGRWQLVKYLLASQKGEHFDREKAKDRDMTLGTPRSKAAVFSHKDRGKTLDFSESMAKDTKPKECRRVSVIKNQQHLFDEQGIFQSRSLNILLILLNIIQNKVKKVQ